MPYQIGFIIEQALGHITHGQNLQRNVAKDATVKAYWGLPTWKTSGLASKTPLYKSNWTVQAGLQTRHALARINREARLDVLFFHSQVTAVLAQDWMRRIPSVVSLDATPRQYDVLGETYAHEPGPKWLEEWKWRLNRDCFRRANRLVTWSQWAKDGLVDEYQVPEQKITVIPPGVNVQEWRPTAAGRVGTLEQPKQPVRILFVGGDLKRKGGLVLLDAFRRLRQELETAQDRYDPAIELHLVTRQVLPEEPGVFVYNNLQPNSAELRNLYFNSHIFCLPTYGDCLPMVLSEAGAAGLPLISTNVGAIHEIVREGETGLLVPAGDSDALVAALRRLTNDAELRLKLGGRAAEVVCREYDAEYNANRLLGLLKETADIE